MTGTKRKTASPVVAAAPRGERQESRSVAQPVPVAPEIATFQRGKKRLVASCSEHLPRITLVAQKTVTAAVAVAAVAVREAGKATAAVLVGADLRLSAIVQKPSAAPSPTTDYNRAASGRPVSRRPAAKLEGDCLC
ncbi:MAG UNVERIFIED_CONTAM: hypothetical protein LVR18_09845 [Planctomycetaceae bacterium]